MKSKSEWVAWDGYPLSGPDLPPNTMVEVRQNYGVERRGRKADFDWSHWYLDTDIHQYRVVEEFHSHDYRYDEKDIPDFSGLFPKMGEWRKVPKGRTLNEFAESFRSQVKDQEVVMKETKYLKHCPYEYIDIYRVLEVYEVTDPCIQHAVKKLLCAGKRGYKEVEKDVQEAIQSLNRWEEMRKEERQ